MGKAWREASFEEKAQLVVYLMIVFVLGAGVGFNRAAYAAEPGSGTEASVMEMVKATPKITALLYRSESLRNEFEKAARCHTQDECRDLRSMSTISADQEKTNDELKPYFKMMADFCRNHQSLPNCPEIVHLEDESKARETAVAEEKKRAEAWAKTLREGQEQKAKRRETNKQKVCWVGQESLPDQFIILHFTFSLITSKSKLK